MAGSTPIYGFPYPESSDLVANYPALGQQLAEDVEDVLAAGIGKVLQVVQGTSTTNVNTTSTTYVTTGLTATITPSSTANKVLVLAQMAARNPNENVVESFTLFRGTVAGTNLGPASGMASILSGPTIQGSISFAYLDSPSTTSAQLYTAGFKMSSAVAEGSINVYGQLSSMILMEVSA